MVDSTIGVNLQQHSAKNVFCPGGRRCGAHEKDLASLHEGDCAAPVTTRFQSSRAWVKIPGIPLRTIEIAGIHGCSLISIDYY